MSILSVCSFQGTYEHLADVFRPLTCDRCRRTLRIQAQALYELSAVACVCTQRSLLRSPAEGGSGTHLLSHTVASIVPSAAPGLTVVFEMGTGVAPGRIGTGNFANKVRDLGTDERHVRKTCFLGRAFIRTRARSCATEKAVRLSRCL